MQRTAQLSLALVVLVVLVTMPVTAAAPSVLAAADDPLLRAMATELQRSAEALRMEKLDKPYFIAYRVDDVHSAEYAATFGSLLANDSDYRRMLEVTVRVGDYALDNTNFLSFPDFSGSMFDFGRSQLPVEDDEQEIRRSLWLATDAAYKDALEQLAKKRAALQNKTRTDELPDFSRQEPTILQDDRTLPEPADRERAESLVQELSQLFRAMEAVNFSTVRLNTSSTLSRYLDSEGSGYTRLSPEVQLTVTATTQAVDGMLLHDLVVAHGLSLDELPDRQELVRSIEELGRRLAVLREAPLPELYNGPVLVEGRAAAELLMIGFVPKLLARRRPVADNPRLEVYVDQMESTFVDKIGARVLPRLMGVIDDPTLSEYDGKPLYGGFAVDDQGVPAAATTVIRRGILKTLLTTRTPVRGISNSTGNCRGPGAAPSNLLFLAEHGLSRQELQQELLALVEERELPYGVIIRRIANQMLLARDDVTGTIQRNLGPGGQAGLPVVAAFRLYPDGREELLRNVRISDLAAAAFKDIMAVSQETTVSTMPVQVEGSSPFGSMGDYHGDSTPLVSIVTPSLLFEDLTLKKPSGEIPKPPVAPHPAFAASDPGAPGTVGE